MKKVILLFCACFLFFSMVGLGNCWAKTALCSFLEGQCMAAKQKADFDFSYRDWAKSVCDRAARECSKEL
jgi:hypothetical protein